MSFRKLLPLFAVVVFACSSAAAHAQLGVYATVTGERVNGLACSLPPANFVGACTTPTTTDDLFGANFGAYYDFRTVGPVRLGVDLRGGVLNSNKDNVAGSASKDLIRHYTALAGLRGSVNTPFRFIRPYGEIAAGYARSNVVSGFDSYNNYTQVEGLIGVDVPILPFMDIRAIEFGAGEMFGPSSHSLQSIGAGIVFHMPR